VTGSGVTSGSRRWRGTNPTPSGTEEEHEKAGEGGEERSSCALCSTTNQREGIFSLAEAPDAKAARLEEDSSSSAYTYSKILSLQNGETGLNKTRQNSPILQLD
jgi:hypothetical protein